MVKLEVIKKFVQKNIKINLITSLKLTKINFLKISSVKINFNSNCKEKSLFPKMYQDKISLKRVQYRQDSILLHRREISWKK